MKPEAKSISVWRVISPLGLALLWLVALYLAFSVRPHLLLSTRKLPVGVWACLLSALLTWPEYRFFRRFFEGRTHQRILISCLAVFNLLFLISQKQVFECSTDVMLTLLASRQYLDGLVSIPNYWYLPDLADISRNGTLWNNWWSPFSVLLPIPFLFLFPEGMQGIQCMIYLVVLSGFIGWLNISARLQVQPPLQIAFAIFLLAHLVFERVFIFYTADILGYAASPWLFWSLLQVTGDFEKEPNKTSISSLSVIAFVCGFFYVIKYSIVFSGVGYFCLLIWWLLPKQLSWRGQNFWAQINSALLSRAAAVVGAFLLPILAFLWLNKALTGVTGVTNQFRNTVDYFSADNLARLTQLSFLPADLFLAVNHIPNIMGTSTFWWYAGFLYIVVLAGKIRLRIPLALLFFCTVFIPCAGLAYTSIHAGQDAMFIARYRFSFAPLAFLILVLPAYNFRNLGKVRKFAAVIGILLTCGYSALPALGELKDFIRHTGSHHFSEWQSNLKMRVLQSPTLTPAAHQVAALWNAVDLKHAVLFTAFDDSSYPLLPMFHGRIANLYFPAGDLNAAMLPYYLQNGVPVSQIAAHKWQTAEPLDIFLLISFPKQRAQSDLQTFKSRFPQVSEWKVLFEDTQFLLLSGKANASLTKKSL